MRDVMAEVTEDLNRIADALSGQPSQANSFIFICKKMPQAGQLGWGEWLKRSGECSLAQEER
jgi:hypothetical protein